MEIYPDLSRHLHSDLGDSPKTSEIGYLSDMSVSDAFRRSLATSFYKKLLPTGSNRSPELAALKKFREVNQRIGEYRGFVANSEIESRFYDYLKNNFRTVLGSTVGCQTVCYLEDGPDPLPEDFGLDYIRHTMSPGPGAAQKADSRTFVTKLFESSVSYCGDDYLIMLFRSALSSTGLWADAEKHRCQRFGFTKVDGGKLFFAKKNAEIARTCCTEPNLNMLIQKALGSFGEDRLLRHFGISLSTQPRLNQELARLGSINGSFGTIDLVSASDSIALILFNDLMEEGFTKAIFNLSRCEFAVLPSGEKVKLNMISTMGNGFTFPLQTILFACVVRSIYQLMGIPERDPDTNLKQFGVFGDDIIVRREAYDFTISMLFKLGFQVNEEKSFNNGPFRESCGGDFFRGTNIRGVYIASLETPQLVCSSINRLHRWSARSGIPLPNTLRFLRRLVPKAPFVPRSEADDAGIHVPFVLSSPIVSNKYWFKYRYYKRHVKRLEIPEADDCLNPYGVGVSFLSGHARRGDIAIDKGIQHVAGSFSRIGAVKHLPVRFSLRDPIDMLPRYKIAHREIPYWDFPGERDRWEAIADGAWEGAVRATLI